MGGGTGLHVNMIFAPFIWYALIIHYLISFVKGIKEGKDGGL